MTAMPTRRDEAWRYADLDAVAAAWPLPAAETVTISENGSFERTIIQSKGAIIRLNLILEKDAKAVIAILNIGGDYGRVEITADLQDGADFNLAAVQIGGAKQNLEIVTAITHRGAGAKSRQLVRSILAGQATGSYLGKVAVTRDAQQTDSEQSVKAMLLDRTATANAKPELEIFADDVKCAHGATVGELDKNALFYLASRGLPPAEAKKLMLHAFVAGVFDGAADEEKLSATALEKLGELV